MNTWLTNFNEYNGLLNPLCITCIKRKFCISSNEFLEKMNEELLDFCKGVGYIQEDPNETTKGT